MTVSYSRLVANGSSFGCFWSILFKWRGSVYKLIWRELLVYLALYFCINLTYRFALDPHQKRVFENIREYCTKHTENIPMSFVLAFYVSLVVKRWWEQYRLLPWPDTLALFVSAAIPGVDERGRLMRRNIVRYAVLAYVITLKHVSVRVKKRFPTLQHIVDAGLMMESEKKIFEMMDERHPMAKYWLPLTWATNIINRARKENIIPSDHMVQTLLTEMSDIRWRLGSLIGYDNVTVPLVYTQVVTLSVYVYFTSALMGRQFVDNPEKDKDDVDIFFPFFTALQFCFYIGWLKVAEVLIGPFGEDDDDIELNWLIDRHIKAAYMIVDEMHEEHPELLKDQYWDDVVPRDLPYTVASEQYRRNEPKGSAEFYKVKETEALYANLTHHRKSVAHDDVYADYESVDTPLVERRKNWFQRQMQRMGSIRSSSTMYSSGLFGGNRTRHNSVYSSPDAVIQVGPVGQLPHTQNQQHAQPHHKMSIYDRLIGRKSTRRGRGPGKLNVTAIPANLKNRPRIPTPDVTKEVTDKDNKLVFPNNNNNHISTVSNALANPTIPDIPVSQHPPVVQVMLSTIQELDGSQSTITSTGSTAALAQAVLSPTLKSAGLTGMIGQPIQVAVTPGVIASTGAQPLLTSFNLVTTAAPSQDGTPKIIEMPHEDRSDSACGSSSGSTSSNEDRSRKTSVTSQHRRGEVYV
ncbi:bestrophin-4 isoform X1 [Cimex lectularius]|uniref:Bestrophin homolog n=1 Tax=Cimex lectularius TaxID=79782 RepID=A0A8I6RH06_CIMLE|nr:bestrophin-4 isoform X1 [Cimex lectularius]